MGDPRVGAVVESPPVQKPPLFTPAFLLLWGFAFIALFSAFQLFPTIPFRIIDLGGTKAHAGWFLAVYTYASAFAAPLTGGLADRIGRRRVIAAACVLFIGFSLLYGIVVDLRLLLLVASLHGAAWSAILSASAALLSEWIPAGRRTEGFAYYGMASTAAVAVAPSAGLFLYRRSWLVLCVGMAVLSLVMLAIVSLVRSKESRPQDREAHALVDWRVMLAALTLFVVSFGYGGVTSYAALLANERGIFPESLYFTVFALAILAIRLLLARHLDALKTRTVLYPALLVFPLALALLAVTRNIALTVISAALFGAGLGAAYPSFVAWILGRTDERRRGATFGSILWAFDIGIGSGSLVVGLIAEVSSFAVAFGVAALISCAAIPIFRMTAPLLRPLARD
jgi:MFS family permease